jgi:ABC-type Na+ efflux pump permease subunit
MMSGRRIRAIVRKELREYRRNRQVVVTMAVVPLIIIVQPIVQVFTLGAAAASTLVNEEPLLYMLAIPAIVPAAIAAFSVAGERQQGTLEPVLTTPIRREEFILGKGLAVLIPSLAVAYGIFGLFLACIELFAQPAVASAVLRGPELIAQLVFTPLVAAWSIWVGIAISARSNDTRVAQQLSTLASLPTVAVTVLISIGAIHATLGLTLGLGAALLIADSLGWLIVAPMFDRERLIAGTRS